MQVHLVWRIPGGTVTTTTMHDGDDDDGSRRRSPPEGKQHRTQKLFVFGDDFADTGNGASDPDLGYNSREWRYPFGMSDTAHARRPSGRFSDGLVQSDFMAKIMSRREAPPPYTYDDWADGIDAAGLNFAVGDSGALDTPAGVTRLGKQVQQLRRLLKDGRVERRDLRDSVALVAYSGNDYAYADDDTFDGLMETVVEELAGVVSDLQDLGVGKVLVNTVPPFGCSPWLTRQFNYTACDDRGNAGPDRHNAALRDLLGVGGGDDDAGGVMLLDVNSIITGLVAPKGEEGSPSALAARFTELLRPCCEATDGERGYCGLDGGYSLCDRPGEYFFWDTDHPTQAG